MNKKKLSLYLSGFVVATTIMSIVNTQRASATIIYDKHLPSFEDVTGLTPANDTDENETIGAQAAPNAGWHKDKYNKYIFYDVNGKLIKSEWIKYGGYWYYLDKEGYMSIGWKKINSTTNIVLASKIWKGSCVNSRRNAATGSTSRKLPEQKVIVPNFKNSFRKLRQGILWL